MTALRIGSLCTGYGGLDMAIRSVLGGELAFVADPDPGAAAILTHHHPDVPNLGDIKLVDWASTPAVDVLAAGYPCQPFSAASRRLGVEDERHIWPWIVGALRVLRPRIAIFENVRGHLGRGFDTVLGDLAALGSDAEWHLVRASDVGAPHRRERLFVVATPADASGLKPERWGSAGVLGSATAAEPSEGDQRQRPGDAAGHRGADASDATDLGHERCRDAWGRRHGSADSGDAAADASRPGLEVRGLEHHGPERPAAERGRCEQATANAERDRWAGRHTEGADRPNARWEGSRAQAEGRSASIGFFWGNYEPAIRRWEYVTGRPAPRPTEPGRSGERLSPRFVEWLMGLPAGHVIDVPGLSRNQQLKALGNGVVPQQGAAALDLLLDRFEAAA